MQIKHLIDPEEEIFISDRLISEWKILNAKSGESADEEILLNDKLCEACHKQSHHFAAKRLLKVFGNSGATFYKHQIGFTVSKCLNGEIPYTSKLKALYRQWMNLEDDMRFKLLSPSEQAINKAKVLRSLDNLLRFPGENRDFESILGPEKYAHLQKLQWDHGENLELQSVEILFAIQNDLDVENRYFLIEACYHLIDNGFDRLIEATVKMHCQAIQQGYVRTMKLFPKLIVHMDLAKGDEVLREVFISAMATIESWHFIPWANQLMSLLHDDELRPMIYPLVTNLAKLYPQTLWFAYNFVGESVKEKCPRLESLLKLPVVVHAFVEALKSVSLPEIILKDFLMDVRHTKSTHERKMKWKEFARQNLTKESKVRKHFFNTVRLNDINNILSKTTITANDITETCAVKKGEKRNVFKLEDFSTFFGSFSKNSQTFDIPGQYGCTFHQPDESLLVKLAGFKEEAIVFNSMRKPIKITMIGDNGKSYEFIVKYGEDIRQDQRIEQVFKLCNNLFKSSIVSYQVIPIFDSLGIIEFVPNTKTLDSMIHMGTEDRKPLEVRPDLKIRDLNSLLRSFGRVLSGNFQQMIQLDHGGGHQLRKAYIQLSSSYEGFFHLRRNFMKSHAEGKYYDLHTTI